MENFSALMAALNHLKAMAEWMTGQMVEEAMKQFSNLAIKPVNFGLVLNPEDDVAANWEIIKQFNAVQIMTIHPGAQGRPFLPEMLNKIDQIRGLGFSGQIMLDGGINDKTLPLIVSHPNKPDIVCPGSYFKEEVASRLTLLKKIASQA